MRNIVLIVHFIGLAMGVGTSLAHMFLGIANARIEKKEAQKFALNAFALNKMGVIGLILLLISGIYLIIPYWDNLANMPMLIAKLILVLVLVVLMFVILNYAGKALKGDPDKFLKRLQSVGPIVLLISITIIILTVITFN